MRSDEKLKLFFRKKKGVSVKVGGVNEVIFFYFGENYVITREAKIVLNRETKMLRN